MSSSKRFLSGSIQTAVELVHDGDIIWPSKCPNFKPFFDWVRAQIWPLCYSPNLRANPAKKKRRKGLSLGVRVREHVVEVSFQKESLQQFSRHASKSNFRTSGHLLICVF